MENDRKDRIPLLSCEDSSQALDVVKTQPVSSLNRISTLGVVIRQLLKQKKGLNMQHAVV